MLDFAGHPITVNLAIFVVASVAVWVAGSRVVRYIDAIADKTRIGQAFAGMLLLGGITSLPEIAAVSGASWIGNAPLSISNLLGSLSMNIVLLCAVDAALSPTAITSVVPGATTLLQGALGIVALALTAGAIATGDVGVLGIGVWSLVLFVVVVFSFLLASRYAKHSPWRADRSTAKTAERPARARRRRMLAVQTELEREPLAQLVARTAVFGAIILFAGFALSEVADAIAKQTGLGSNYIGLVLIGLATALPNLSSIVAAVRLERFEMAISDVFGANLFNLGLIILADAVFAGGPILNQAGRFEIVAALLGIVLTAIYLIGLLERENRTIFGMGYDSFAVLWTYLAGLVLLHFVS
jgi:cation:H+ antiporter